MTTRTPAVRRHTVIARALTVVVFAAFTASTLVAATPAGAGGWSEIDQTFAMINDQRAWEGVAPVAWDQQLSDVAQWWAEQMAGGRFLAHNPSLADQVTGWWWKLGENVGRGPAGGLDTIQAAFVNSPHHHANMVNPDFNYLGLGVAYDGYGTMYVVHVYAQF